MLVKKEEKLEECRKVRSKRKQAKVGEKEEGYKGRKTKTFSCALSALVTVLRCQGVASATARYSTLHGRSS
jgi:hypothetical protein